MPLSETYRRQSTELAERSRQEVLDGLRGLGLAETRCVLVDVPNHANWGDSVIWQGQRAACAELGMDLVDEIEGALYDPMRVRKAVRDGVLLLSGGGNFGDLYPRHQDLREMLLREFRDLRIVQMPQSIWFEKRESLERTRRAIGEHPNMTLVVRDRPSLDFARRHFDCAVCLMPDMAFALGPLERPIAPSVDIVWLRRSDAEAPAVGVHTSDPPTRVTPEDWSPSDLPRRVVRRHLVPIRVDLRLRSVQRRFPRSEKAVVPLRRLVVPHLGNARFGLATLFLARGRVVVTDRLHGHILCVLLGIPHVLLDNRIGKLSAYLDTWSHHAEIDQLAENDAEALAAALALVEEA